MKSQKKHHFQKKAMHFKSPLAMGRDAFKPKHASSVSISEVIDTGANSNKIIHLSHRNRVESYWSVVL